jgi:hypothetical protein
MPTISQFLGILIRIYYDDHNPPHFHVMYPEVLSRQPHRRKAWFKSYIDSILKRDITEVCNETKPNQKRWQDYFTRLQSIHLSY